MTSRRVGYLTDVEGNWDYFQNYIKLSTIIKYDAHNNLTFQEDNTLFVFGGDVCDKGTGSIRIARQLVAFKKKFPERVILILGNRDINKMRWTSELALTEIDNIDSIPGPYWVKKDPVSPKQFLQKLADQQKVPLQTVNTVANRIKWMLEATMGAAGDFERRRAELKILLKKRNITDDLVANSYVDSVKPNGEMYELLYLGQLAFIHEETIYVHGGITKGNLGYVPFSQKTYDDVAEWVEELNNWYRLEFLDWTVKPRWDYQKGTKLFVLSWGEKFNAAIQGIPSPEEHEIKAKWSARGAHRLMDYALPTAKGSVVYAHMFSRHNNVQALDAEVVNKLKKNNIFRLITGHQPHGNAPAVNKDFEGFEAIDSDSSYSDMTAPDNRGRAVSEVVIAHRKVFVQGILHDSTPIKYELSLSKGEGDPFVGKRVPLPDDKDGNSFWVKAKLATKPFDGREYVICKVSGFVVCYDFMSKEKLEEIILGKRVYSVMPDVCSVKLLNGGAVPITKLPTVLTSLREIIANSFFEEWLKKIQSSPDLKLESVEVQSVDYTGLRIRFIKLSAQIKSKNGDSVSGVAFLRGNSVAVLCILRAEDERKYVVAVRHQRTPIGASDHLEIPVGMEDHKPPMGVIRNLLQNESGIELETDVAINLSQELFNKPDRPIYVSPGSCDQGVQYFLIEKAISNEQLADIQSKKNSSYETVLVPFDRLEEQCNDGNAIIAARLYDLYLRKKEQDAKLKALKAMDISGSLTTSSTDLSGSGEKKAVV